MDVWEFKKWRKKIGYTQVEAGEKLGLSRAAVQLWENEIRPVPLTVELACQELWRHWKQRPEFGPVTLLYADDPIWQTASPPDGVLLLQSERHPNNESAIRSAVRPRETMTLFVAFIIEDDGNVIRSGPELLREIDARNGSIGEKTAAGKALSSR